MSDITGQIAEAMWNACQNQTHHGGAWTSNGPPQWVR